MENKGTLNELRESIEKYKKNLLDLDQLGEKIVQTLILRDKINRLICALEQKKADLSVEKSRLDSLDHIIKDRPQFVWKKLKGYIDPLSYRQKHKIPSSSWWWYLDEILKNEKRRYTIKWIKRLAIAAGAILCLYLILTYAVPKPDPYTSSISEADRLMDEGKINLALEAYQRAMGIDSEKPTAYLMAGVIYGFLGEKEKAEKHFTEAKKRATSLHDFYLQRGMSWMRLGQFFLAQEDGEKAVEINPQSAEAHFLLGNAYEAQDKIAKAIAHFSIVSDMDANPQLTVMARYKIGMLALRGAATPPRKVE